MRKNILILLAVIVSISYFNPAVVTAETEENELRPPRTRETPFKNQTPEEDIWGEIRHYTNRGITLKTGQQYTFSKNVLIDVENLGKDERGNVRIVLDDSGNAAKIFFNGIDMPNVIRQFKR